MTHPTEKPGDAVPRYIEYMGALYIVADMIHVEILRNAPQPCGYVPTGWAHPVEDETHLGACSCRPMTKRDALVDCERVIRTVRDLTHSYRPYDNPTKVRSI